MTMLILNKYYTEHTATHAHTHIIHICIIVRETHQHIAAAAAPSTVIVATVAAAVVVDVSTYANILTHTHTLRVFTLCAQLNAHA